jgi:membrane protease YdiL (CAAX protease family)
MISTSILYAWLYNSTNGSLILVMVAHAGHNLAIDFIPLPENDGGVAPLLIAILYLVAAVAVVLSTDAKSLRRRSAPREGSDGAMPDD